MQKELDLDRLTLKGYYDGFCGAEFYGDNLLNYSDFLAYSEGYKSGTKDFQDICLSLS